jgi:O-antigen/teichoic acid export membrane protein
MPANSRIIVWGYAAQALNVSSGLILLPVIVLYLDPNHVGMWYVFLTIAGLALLMEQGFQPTISRNVAYVYAGAQELSETGLSDIRRGEFNQELLGDLLESSRWIYRRITFVASLLLLTVGTGYVWTLVSTTEERLIVITAWLAFCSGSLLNFYFGYMTAFLNGRGDIVQASQVTICGRLTNLVIGSVMVATGGGLLGLGVASLAAAITSRALASHYLKTKLPISQTGRTVSSVPRCDHLVKVIWHNASRFGLVLLGLFMITRANVLIASAGLGLTTTAGYGLAVQLLLAVQAIASVPLNLALPMLNALRVQCNDQELYRRFGLTLVYGLSIGLAGAIAMVLIAPRILTFMESRTTLPQTSLLILMALAFLLELNHGICANLLSTKNTVPFTRAYIMTGFVILTLSAVSIHWMGLLGIILINLLCQLAYNNWRWPKAVANDFRVSYITLLRDGLMAVRSNYLASTTDRKI